MVPWAPPGTPTLQYVWRFAENVKDAVTASRVPVYVRASFTVTVHAEGGGAAAAAVWLTLWLTTVHGPHVPLVQPPSSLTALVQIMSELLRASSMPAKSA